MTKGENEVCSEIKGISSDLQMITHIVSFVKLCAHVYECVCVHVGVVCRYIVHLCEHQGSTIPVFCFILFFLQGPSMAWNSLNQLGWLAIEL